MGKTMTLLNKILIALLATIVITAFAFIIYQQHEMKTMQTQITASVVAQQTLLDGITRSQAQYATKADLDAFAAANNVSLTQIEKNVDALGATITGMNQITVNQGPVVGTNLPSSSTTPDAPTTGATTTNNDPYGYQKNIQNLQLAEPFTATGQTSVSVPVGSVSFDATKPAPWSENLYQRTYAVSNVLATDPDGKQYVYNQFSITTNGQTYKAPIQTAAYVQQYPVASFSLWNPRIFLGLDAGVLVKEPLTGTVSPSVNFGFMSYGKSKVSPDWSFVQLGVGFNSSTEKIQFQLSPVQYRLPIPFVKNTSFGPTVAVDVNGTFSGMVGFRVGM